MGFDFVALAVLASVAVPGWKLEEHARQSVAQMRLKCGAKLSKVDVKTLRSAKSECPTVYNSTRASAKIECLTLFLIGTTEIELKKCRHRNVRPYRSIHAAQKVNVQPYYRSTRASAKIKCPTLFLIGITEIELKKM